MPLTSVQTIVDNGIQHHRNQQWDDAKHCYEQALSLDPHNSKIQLLLANLLLQMDNLQYSGQLIKSVLKTEKNNAEAHHLAGMLHIRKKAYNKAEASLKQAIKLQPEHCLYHARLAEVYQSLNKQTQALAAYKACIQLEPNVASIYLQAGLLLVTLNNYTEAILFFKHAIALQKNYITAYEKLAQTYFLIQDYKNTILTYQEQLNYSNNKALVLNNIALTCQTDKQFSNARTFYQQALNECTSNANIYLNLASLDLLEFRHQEAIGHLQTAINIDPENAIAYNNLGNALVQEKNAPAAIQAYLKAIKLLPDYADAHLNLAYSYLRQGDYINGWREHEWRRKSSNTQPGIPSTTNMKHIRPSMRVLIETEQGIGDTIQFIRFLPLLKKTACHITLLIKKDTLPLFENSDGVDIVKTTTDPIRHSEYDLTISLMSLPFILGLDRKDIAEHPPCLRPTFKNKHQWRQYFDNGKINIGIAWAGNPEQGNDHNRSTQLNYFLALTSLTNINLVSLQYGNARKQLIPIQDTHQITDLGYPWDETASIISQLDLVISVDTSIAHLAAAIGTPTWVLLTYLSDWRWLAGGEKSPWYPKMTLIRQRTHGDWNELFDRVKKMLLIMTTNKEKNL